MKVILKQDINGLGKKESMHEVSDGYARNYLLPRGVAVQASASNLNIMNTRKDAEKSKKDREIANAKVMAEKLSSICVVFKTKAGENGKLFGSITSKDIADKLHSDFKFDIDKKKIHLPEALKAIGITEVEIKLVAEVTAKISVKIEQDG